MWDKQASDLPHEPPLYAVMAISNGMPIESVSKVLGHTKITTTQHYAKITTEKLDKDFSMLESKISDKMKLV